VSRIAEVRESLKRMEEELENVSVGERTYGDSGIERLVRSRGGIGGRS
jgi:hypothetical protein